MGAYRMLGVTMQNGKEERVHEEFYKYANFAKEDTEKRILKGSTKWTPGIPYMRSATHDNVEINGTTYNKVTFLLHCIHLRQK